MLHAIHPDFFVDEVLSAVVLVLAIGIWVARWRHDPLGEPATYGALLAGLFAFPVCFLGVGLSAPSGPVWGRIWIVVVLVFVGAAVCALCVLHFVWVLRFLPEGKIRILGVVGCLVGPACFGGVTIALSETTSSWQAIETMDSEPIDLASVDASVVESTPSFVLREARCHRRVRYRHKPPGGKTSHEKRFRSIQGAEGTDLLPPGLWMRDSAACSTSPEARRSRWSSPWGDAPSVASMGRGYASHSPASSSSGSPSRRQGHRLGRQVGAHETLPEAGAGPAEDLRDA